MSDPADDTGRAGFRGLVALPTPQDTDGQPFTDLPAMELPVEGPEMQELLLGVVPEGEPFIGPSGAPDAESFLTDEPADWAWVEEWRAGGEPVPWGPGLALAGFVTLLVGSAVFVLCDGLADRPIVAIGVNVLVAGGLGPALWLSRSLPVLRWIAGGAVLGVLLAWLSVLIFLV